MKSSAAMRTGVGFLLRQVSYDLRVGLLLRPGVMTLGYAGLAIATVAVERRLPAASASWRTAWLLGGADAAAAQIVLGTIAGSMMTVVSIVYSVLVMALSLLSIQFSPRILATFIADAVSQTTLGIFVGTFTYSLIVLRTIQTAPVAFVPGASVTLGMLLALVALGWLLYFIHHIATGIQANRIVDRIARETLEVVKKELPEPLDVEAVATDEARGSPSEEAARIPAPASGYIQLVDVELLTALAREHRVTLTMDRAVGQFVVGGNTILRVEPAERMSAALRDACGGAFDLGEVRTMQQDVEFGIRQVVDMGLKAISPAVNDPSTAATCIDHLGRILCEIARRRPAPREIRHETTGDVLLVRRTVTFERALDLAFNQLRQYGRGDMAVALRIARALGEIAEATDHAPYEAHVLRHARLLELGLAKDFQPEDREELGARMRALRSRCAGAPPPPPG